jgi:hypothetical protein
VLDKSSGKGFNSQDTAGSHEVEVSMGRNYDRVVTPESDLPIACLKCGHVTRAFDANCPQCGASLEPRRDRPSRGSGLTIFIILGVVVSVGILLGVVSYGLSPSERVVVFGVSVVILLGVVSYCRR